MTKRSEHSQPRMAAPPNDEMGSFAESDMLAMLRDAHEAERFERDVLGLAPELVGTDGPHAGASPASSGLRWRGMLATGVTGGLAAAAALTAALVLRPTLPGGATTTPPRDREGVVASGTVDATTPGGMNGASKGGDAVEIAASKGAYLTPDELMAELQRLAHLDPGIREGLPSLSADRTMMVAMSRDREPGCDCFDWVVESPDAVSSAKPSVAQAVRDACGLPDDDVVVFAITGPRGMLPFHDEDARELAACLVERAEASQPEGASPEALTLAALAAQDCVPMGLTVHASWR